MSFPRWLEQSATITSRGPASAAKNEYGRPVEDPEVQDPVPCLVQSTGGVEVLIGRDTVIANYRVYFPAGTVIDATDTFTVDDDRYDGLTFEVMGQPLHADGRRGEHHVEVLAREVLG